MKKLKYWIHACFKVSSRGNLTLNLYWYGTLMLSMIFVELSSVEPDYGGDAAATYLLLMFKLRLDSSFYDLLISYPNPKV